MLQLELQQTKKYHAKNKVRYWIVTFTFQNIQPFEFKVRSLPELATVSGIPLQTLKRIIYDPDYHSKKYSDFLKYVEFQAVY